MPGRENQQQRKERVKEICKVLAKEYPNAKCALDFANPLQLLVATILSAQCTDVRVNMVTPALFKKYPTAKHFAESKSDELQKMIQSTGFFRNKAKNIQGSGKRITEEFAGKVPGTMEELLTLPGVARKTANVVLGNAFDVPGITVDTHMMRLSQRLGMTRHTEPVKIEQDLNALVPQPDWTRFSHQVITHGRQICHARKPKCSQCVLLELCPRIGVKESV